MEEEDDDWRPGVGLFREVVLGPALVVVLLLFRILSPCESEAMGQEGGVVGTGTLEGLDPNSFGV
jgi:hypothetical protein